MSSNNGWGVDCIWWTPSKRKIFEVRLFFFFFFFPFAFLFRVDTLGVSSFPWKSMWRVKSSFESEFLCVDGHSRKDSDYG
jgi:hypothetical protein